MQLSIRIGIFVLSAFVLILGSCKKDQSTVDFHYDYFDLTPGRYITYQVKEIVHDAGAITQHDTMDYQLKTVIGDTVIDNQGRIAREFLRYKRNTSSDSWVLADVWTTIISERRAELIEENQRVVKMVFAPTINKVWDMNAYNTLGGLECYYRDVHIDYSINGFSFDSTVIVEQEDFSSLVDHRRKYEVYANGIGLVYKYYKHLEIQNFDSLNVKNGNELFYTLTSYGFE
jgi:hypothetical protein